MPIVQKYYPPISDLIDMSSLPSNLEGVKNLLQQGADLLLKKIFYKNLTVEVSNSGDSRFYYLVILSRSLKFPLLADINLVFFKGAEVNMSEFPIVFEWQWPLFKYFPRFETRGFSYAPEAFLDILIELSQINERKEFFDQIVSVFLDNGDDLYIDFLDKISSYISIYNNGDATVASEIQNIQNNIDIVKNELDSQLTSTNLFTLKSLYDNYQRSPSFNNAVSSIKESIENLEKNHNISINIYRDILINLLLGFSDVDDKFSRLLTLFQHWIEDINKEDIKSFLIPQFSLRLNNINMGLEFPRKWLTPVYTGSEAINNLNINEPLPEPYQSTLEFTVGNLIYSTRTGFRFENQSSFTFKRSIIGNTGLLVEFFDLKVDMSDTYNIPEAKLDGRPDNFQGVYAAKAAITLPSKWFNNVDNTTLQIVGYNMLVGTGGLSGTIALEAINGASLTDSDYLNVKIGNWQLGFNRFDVLFKQNDIVYSNLRAKLIIPKFKKPNGDIAEIDVIGHLQGNGDFKLTASTTAPHPVIEFGDVFKLHLKSVELGREEEDFYLGTVADIEFKGILNTLLEGQGIIGTDLRIYSNGRIDFKANGGKLVLNKTFKINLGPVELSVGAIHFGSHERQKDGQIRKYNYFGFDAGVNIGIAGIDARGNGLKFYYSIDDAPDKPHDSYLHIQTIDIDLILPANSQDPSVMLKGKLSIPEPGISSEFTGSVDLKIKNPRVTGHVDMRLSPKHPSFLIEAGIELPNPIPLGPVSIFGFKGLLGYRYVAEKEAIGMTSENTWYEYYKAPIKGVDVEKFSQPEQTANYGFPFSLGAGAIIGDTTSAGNIISANAMLLLSLPSMVMMEARMKLLSKRVSFADDPPFFAFLVFGDNSLELGFGADYKFPESTGDIMKMYAEVQAGFFFNSPSSWYINFGTQQTPISAKLLKDLFTLKAFLMISAKGIQAGARGEFGFERSFGPVRIKTLAYLELGGRVSFERSQMGGYFQAGLAIDIDVKCFRIYASTNILLGVESPKPFLIYGKFDVQFKIKVFFFKLNFNTTIELKWQFNNNIDRAPINPFINQGTNSEENASVKGISMLTGEIFGLENLKQSNGSINIDLNKIRKKVVPLDTYIDIKTTKGLLPNNIGGARIGGVNNAPDSYTDLVPPEKIMKGIELRQVKHQYSIENIDIMAYSSTMGWQAYNPYKALLPNDSDPMLDRMNVGQWQKKDNQYNAIRLLATTPFSYTEQGLPGWFIPEQYGITPTSIFCESERKKYLVSNFIDKPLGTQYYSYNDNFFYSGGASYQINGISDFIVTPNNTLELIGAYAQVTNEPNIFTFSQSLQFPNNTPLIIKLSAPSAEINLKLSTYSSGVTIEYYKPIINDNISFIEYQEVESIYLESIDLRTSINRSFAPIDGVTKIIIRPVQNDIEEINRITTEMAQLMDEGYQNAISQGGEFNDITPSDPILYAILEQQLAVIKSKGCQYDDIDKDENACLIYPNLIQYLNNKFRYPLSFDEEDLDKDSVINQANYIKLNAKDYITAYNLFKEYYFEDDILNVNLQQLDGLFHEFDELVSNTDDSHEGAKNIVNLFEIIKAKYIQLKERISIKRACNDSILCELSTFLSLQDFIVLATQGNKSTSPIFEAYNSFIEKNSEYQYLSEILEYQLNAIETILYGINSESMSYYEYETIFNSACQELINIISDLGNCNNKSKCVTLFHEIKWLSVEDYQFNLSIRGQEAITEDAEETIAGINKFAQPIWRPDTSYYVRFKLKDTVDNGQGQGIYEYAYGFHTAGPVGFFHLDQYSPYGLISTEQQDQYPHTSIRNYIDYERSYPNADGNLVNAKPLFYDDKTTEILLYFTSRYAFKHLEGWDALMDGTTEKFPALGGTMKILIKDPLEDIEIVNPPRLDTTIENIENSEVKIPQTIEHWVADEDPLIPPILNQWVNLLNANNCVGIREIIKPKSFFRKVTPKRLKPQKLYTAQVLNFYWGTNAFDISNITDSMKAQYAREVHKFVFQTSRYSDFKEQVNSYILSFENEDNTLQIKEAIYEIRKELSQSHIQAALDTIKGINNPLSNAISQQFIHPFDRIIEGLFEFPPMEEAISTEFNKIIDTNTNEVVALLIRNPEPFNHPKIPLSDIMKSHSNIGMIEVLNSDLTTINNNYHVLYSKDYSQALIMNNNNSMEEKNLNFQFIYKTWDGSKYQISDIQIVKNILIN